MRRCRKKSEKVAVDKKEEIPLRTGVVSAKEVLLPEDNGAMDDEDMLMYNYYWQLVNCNTLYCVILNFVIYYITLHYIKY